MTYMYWYQNYVLFYPEPEPEPAPDKKFPEPEPPKNRPAPNPCPKPYQNLHLDHISFYKWTDLDPDL